MTSFNSGTYLYRALLREHRRLPPAMRQMGNEYIRSEFKLHKSAKTEHLGPFFKAWEDYLSMLKKQHGSFGANMDLDAKGKLNKEQIDKLAELKKESVNALFSGDQP